MEIAVMGIDPGITGGFAAICSTHILVDDLPVLTEANGKRKEKALWRIADEKTREDQTAARIGRKLASGILLCVWFALCDEPALCEM